MLKKVVLSLAILSLASCTLTGNLTSPTGSSSNKRQSQDVSKISDKADAKPEDSKLKNVAVDKVQIISGDNIVINQGDKLALSANVLYEDNSRNSTVLWSSSDNTIVVINPTTWAVSGAKPGIATVIATSLSDSSKRASTTVTVKQADVVEALTKIEPKEATLKVGDTVRLDAKIQLSDGSVSPNVVWKSDNESIALVTNGLVTAISIGSTTITAIASGDSTKKAFSKITVLSDSPQASASPVTNK